MCCIVDGDDYLEDSSAITKIDLKLEDDHLMFCSNKNLVDISGNVYGFTESSKIQESGYKTWESGEAYPHPRQQGFLFHHFRGFKKILSDNVDTGRSFYSPTGDLIRAASDLAYFSPMIEMAGSDRILTSNLQAYNYRDQLSTNDSRLYGWQQARNAKFITQAFSGLKWHDGSQTVEEFCSGIGVPSSYLTNPLKQLVNISGTKYTLQSYGGAGKTGQVNDLMFDALFGGTELTENYTYNFPNSAETWGGFSVLESNMFPRGFQMELQSNSLVLLHLEM